MAASSGSSSPASAGCMFAEAWATVCEDESLAAALGEALLSARLRVVEEDALVSGVEFGSIGLVLLADVGDLGPIELAIEVCREAGIEYPLTCCCACASGSWSTELVSILALSYS